MHLPIQQSETEEPPSRGTSSPRRATTGKSASPRSLQSLGPLRAHLTALPFRGTPSHGKGKASNSPKVLRRSPGRAVTFTGTEGKTFLGLEEEINATDTEEGQLSGTRALRCSVGSMPLWGLCQAPRPKASQRRPSRACQLQPIDKYPRCCPRHRCPPTRSLQTRGWGGTGRGKEKAPKGETHGGAQHPR